MAIELMLEKWPGKVSVVSIGATKEDGGSRTNVVKIGGQVTLPFLSLEGKPLHKPVIAFEIWDVFPSDWPKGLIDAYGDSLQDPLAWAEECVKKYQAQILCLKLQGAHPDLGNKSIEEEVKLVEQLFKRVSVPFIILGSGDDAKDNLLMPAVCEATKGEKCLIGSVVQDNYKTLVVAVLADGHNIVAESPIDINIAKQLNILISDLGLPLGKIVINPTIGALGYGLEYAYSIMERARLAALAGDQAVANPFICFVGQESWRAKEAKASSDEFPSWGKELERGIVWEIVTASSLLQAGADILVMRHPKAIEKVNKYLDSF